MTRIGRTDQVLLLVQEQLSRLGKEKGRASGKGRAEQAGTAEPINRLRALAASHGLSEEDIRRALVRSVLADQFGEAIGADPRFETLAVDVMRIIDASDEGRALIQQSLERLSNS